MGTVRGEQPACSSARHVLRHRLLFAGDAHSEALHVPVPVGADPAVFRTGVDAILPGIVADVFRDKGDRSWELVETRTLDADEARAPSPAGASGPGISASRRGPAGPRRPTRRPEPREGRAPGPLARRHG